jgi:lysophospholipid acyltransferase (LPLAT)-like uncharacterized protein
VKGFLRSAPAQWTLAMILTGYIWLMLKTVRWTHYDVDKVEPTLAGDGSAVALFWHGRIGLCLATAPQWWRKRTRALISPSADGEFIAKALASAGFIAIRGSSAKAGDVVKTRNASAAFREAMTWLKGGGCLVITPDGPRGPNEQIAPGSLQIARRAQAPVYLMGIAARPCFQLDTWDKAMFGLPFGRGAVVWDGPLMVPAKATDEEVEAVAADWSARLSAATRRAEELLA